MNTSRLLAATMVAGAGPESGPGETGAKKQASAPPRRVAKPGKRVATTPRRWLASLAR